MSSQTAGEITPRLFGHNLEHAQHAVWQGTAPTLAQNG
jgi:hypothetical protein